jgi:hypothetical protein
LFHRPRDRTLAEGSTKPARAKRTQRVLRLQPMAVTRRAAKEQNVTEPSNPSLVMREGERRDETK